MTRFSSVVIALLTAVDPAAAQTVTTLLYSGPPAQKKDLVIIGDGFQSGAGQDDYDAFVDKRIMTYTFGDGPLWESMSAFNIHRVNVASVDAGVTQIDADGNVTTARNTALGIRYSGVWPRCWMEDSPETASLQKALLAQLGLSHADYVFVVLNEDDEGGCRTAEHLTVTLATTSDVCSHEMGHLVGDLCDEYVKESPTTYAGGEPGCVNLTINTDRNTIKWREFIDPATPIVTTATPDVHGFETVGAFAGGTLAQSTFDQGLYRPVFSGRMSVNWTEFGPVGYTQMKSALSAAHDHSFNESYKGDFDGDGRDDLVVHNGNALELYTAGGVHLRPRWVQTLPLAGWDSFRKNDTFAVADFDGDGLDDLYVVNFHDWSVPYLGMLRSDGHGFVTEAVYAQQLPGWDDMRANDQLFASDFDGDGKDDLLVFNGSDWPVAYLGMLRSTGTTLEMVARYDDQLPLWDSMRVHDRFVVADVDADGKSDLYVFNGDDWNQSYLEVLRSTGSGLVGVERHDGVIAGWDAMLSHDQLLVADFDGDHDDDLYIWNGDQWSMPYLGALEVSNGTLQCTTVWSGWIDGWSELAPRDTFHVGDVNADGKDDLYVYNGKDWVTEYLGVLIAGVGPSLSGSWQEGALGVWDLRPNDELLVGNFGGARRGVDSGEGGLDSPVQIYSSVASPGVAGHARDDLIIMNLGPTEWLGLLSSTGRGVSEEAVYKSWIHDHRYHRDGLW